ncbi:MAG: hypothetical protein QXW02_02485, partial [Nitrososphaerota archaeon]
IVKPRSDLEIEHPCEVKMENGAIVVIDRRGSVKWRPENSPLKRWSRTLMISLMSEAKLLRCTPPLK